MLDCVKQPPRPTQEQTIEAILRASDRNAVPIRTSFVQGRAGRNPVPGPLSALVRRGRGSTLEQYLLLHAWASGGHFDVARDARIWARALGLSEDEAGRRTIGRNWKILRKLGLVQTERRGRIIKATMLDEGGLGKPYVHPAEGEAQERYLQLSYEYWSRGFHSRLDVPGKAVLLIALTLGDWFSLPTRRGPDWYGLSRSTLERGFRSVRREGVLEMVWEYKEAPLAPEGYTRENYHRLQPPFGPRGVLASGAHPRFSPVENPAQPQGSARRQRPPRDGSSHGPDRRSVRGRGMKVDRD